MLPPQIVSNTFLYQTFPSQIVSISKLIKKNGGKLIFYFIFIFGAIVISFRRIGIIFPAIKITFRRIKITFLGTEITFRRIKIIFPAIKIMFRRIKITFLAIRITFRRIGIIFRQPPISKRVFRMVKEKKIAYI